MGYAYASGEGPGAITPDGCSVEVYTRYPVGDEPKIIRGAVPRGSSILELGAGVGRVTHPLLELGYEVVAVDESAEMLAHISGADTVRASIQDLDLGRRFDAVLLMSHLVEIPDAELRLAFLRTCRRHVGDGGRVLFERLPPEVFDGMEPGERVRDGLTVRVREVNRPEPAVAAIVFEYEADGMTWTQSYVSRRLDDADLDAILGEADLTFDGFLTPDRAWFRAVPLAASPG
jgi:SAM-dependent methyltransferase